ncbi:MAG: PSD1 and planctomycete cytochrome C domain-containing protein [Pirellulales bacterium]
MKSTYVILLLSTVFLLFAKSSVSAEAPVAYETQIKPILASHCYQCHGPDNQESDLRLDTAQHAITGGVNGTSIEPGKPELSLLLSAISGTSEDISIMPPEDEAESLSDEQITLISNWIKQGAKHPADEQEAIATKGKDHWAFQPVVRHALPAVKQTGWPTNPIDFFILNQLEQNSIVPSKEADRTTLIRRVSLDLIGLPPTLAEVQDFVNDPAQDAYERLVDRLLSSPHYGERWGRHWLDLARYADSDGYTNDQPKVMWKYRDWVIDALNRNMPFDQFTLEQFAGDMLPQATTDQIVASGFHRNTQINREGGSDAEQYRTVAVNDRVSTTGIVYLGLTVGCAKCHNHKFDPISQKEYYQLFAILNNQSEPTHTLPVAEPVPADYQLVSAQLSEAEQLLKKSTDEEKPAQQKEVDALKKQRDTLKRQYYTSTYIMRELPKPRETRIFIRGEYPATGKIVKSNVPAILHDLPTDIEEPNRIDLARWLASPDNPLTPRVTMNRLWQRYFGTGIVETENDFGTQGASPSHPKLIDWLASEFVNSGFDMKQMHKTIVTSSSYRQSSHARNELHELDPNNRLLARQSRLRLDAELIRDSALHTAGVLTAKLKGPSVYPPQPAGVMKLTRNPNRRWTASQTEDRFRRTMYTYFWRSTPYPFLRTFDSPESNTSCTRRDRSNTPLQALTLLNEEGFVEAAQTLAVRVLSEMPEATNSDKLRHTFQLCLKRVPNSQEMAALNSLLEAELKDPSSATTPVRRFISAQSTLPNINEANLMTWTTIARTLLNLDEFITRE